MHYFDFKKLVSLFLLVATAFGSLAFLFSDFALTFSLDEERETARISDPTTQNAFVEPIPSFPLPVPSPEPEALSDADLPPIPETDNLTELFTGTMTREFIRANPQGPQGKERALVAPEIETLLRALPTPETQPPSFKPRTIPRGVSVIQNPTREDIESYLGFLEVTVGRNAVRPQFALLSESLPEKLNAGATAIEEILLDVKHIRVPAPFLELHTLLLELFTERESDLRLLQSSDPLRAYYTIKAKEAQYEHTLLAFSKAVQNAGLLLESQGVSENAPTSLLHRLFGVSVAKATLPVFDPANLAQSISEFLKWLGKVLLDALIQQLKTTMIHRMSQQVIGWIQGNGKPQFVTNWKGFLEDSANVVAGGVIQQAIPFLCTPFRAPLKLLLTPIPSQNLLTPIPTCTLDDVVSNVREFSRDFRNGGWEGYLSLLAPQNNFWGAALITAETMAVASAREREAAKNEGTANAGFLSSKICTAPKTVNIEAQTPPEGCDPTTFGGCNRDIEEANAESEIKSFPGYVPGSAVCKNGVCTSYKTCDANGWQATTPGTAVGAATTEALTSAFPNIVGAEDISAIIAALVDSALNKLIFSGDKGLLGVSTKKSSQFAEPDPQAGFFSDAYGVVNNKETSLSLYEQAIDIGDQALPLFNEAIAECHIRIERATAIGNAERTEMFNKRLTRAEQGKASLLPFVALILSKQDALRTVILNAKIFIETIEEEQLVKKTVDYVARSLEFSTRFGSIKESRTELAETQDVYIDIQRRLSRANTALDDCVPGDE